MEGIVPIIKQSLPVEIGHRSHFIFFARRNFLAQCVELFWRIKMKEFPQIRALRNPLSQAADEKAVPQFLITVLKQRHREAGRDSVRTVRAA